MKLSGRLALVTGGAGGLGREVARRLHMEGAQVVVADCAPAALDALATDPAFAGITRRQVDLRQPDAVAELLDALADKQGVVDILVNCAGLIANAPLVNPLAKAPRAHPLALWQAVIDANLTATFVVSAAVVERLLAKRSQGVVINFSSVSASGNPGQSAYSAAKAGVNALTRAWAQELGPAGIRVVAIAPGFVDTHATAAALPASALQRAVERVPLRRLALADEVVSAVLFAIANDFVTGTILEVDGGLVM